MNTQPNPQLPLPLKLSDTATLNNFLVGNNTELLSAIRACVVMGDPALVYFYGPGSSGKSHLLFAAIKHANQNKIKSTYLSLIDPNVNPQLLDMITGESLICIDNIGAWAGCEEQERALFSLFERVKQSGGQMLISASHTPEKSNFSLPDLISRISSGLVYPVRELSSGQQLQAIKMRAKNRGLSISDDAVHYLLKRSSRDTGELFALLDEIDLASLVEKRKITIPFLKSFIHS